jgi:hypothetical protein
MRLWISKIQQLQHLFVACDVLTWFFRDGEGTDLTTGLLGCLFFVGFRFKSFEQTTLN